MMNIVKCYMLVLHKIMKLLGMQPKQIEIQPGTSLHFWVDSNYYHNNNKKKQPVILLHGFAGDGILTWQFQVLSLRKKYSLFVPDLLFFGGSHTNKPERSTKFQADCVAQGLKKLGVEEKCMVVGFSYGGFVGFEMARHHPDLVAALVVTGSVPHLTESLSSRCLNSIGFASWPDLLMPTSAEGVKLLLDTCSYRMPWMPLFFYKHFLQIMYENRKERVELLEALVVKDEDASDHAITNQQIQQRIYLLWGNEESIFNVDVANKLKENLGGKTELEVIEKAGHLALMERPWVFNECLRKMLRYFNTDTEHKEISSSS